MKKVLICIGIILLFGLGILVGFMIPKKCDLKCKCNDECTCEKEKCLGNMFEFVTEDGGIPGNTYIVTMGFEKKSLHVIKVMGCSALDCEVSDEESYTTLTDDELSKVKEILSKIDFSERYKHFDLKVSLAKALNNIATDQKIISSKEKEEETYNNVYKKYDINNDGTVTGREYGDSYLDSIYKDLDKLLEEK
ncbi:MAG: hypothetical protein IKP07_02190 [Bacilli bacterium]|nr:hypothetical protein [Bacilli bacterium]